jgi:hypothetical protein
MSIRFLFCLAAAAALSMGSLAQSPPASSPPATGADIGSVILEFVPPPLAGLGSQAVANESFTLDRTMLAAASGMLPDSDADLRQTVARLDGVSVHMLRFAADGVADPAQVQAIREAYHLRGWKHVLDSTSLRGQARNDTTDVWLVMDGANVRGGVVMVETPKSLTLATVAGNLSPLDLLHLRGHFGIPRFDADRFPGEDRR